jgi:hypothetical protein
VLLHKLREAMAAEMRGRVIGGEGKIAEVDPGYFGGYVRPANLTDHRLDRRFAMNQSGRCEDNTLPAVVRTEAQALNFIRSRIAKGTIVNAPMSRRTGTNCIVALK